MKKARHSGQSHPIFSSTDSFTDVEKNEKSPTQRAITFIFMGQYKLD